MSSIDELMSQIPISQLASQLGVDEAQAEQGVRYALPALVGGMAANAEDPGGAASLAEALQQHVDDAPDGGIDLGQVDTADGEKIVHHVFGDNEGAVVNQLGGLGELGGGLFAKLLPLLAPLLMGFVAKSVLSKGGGGGGATSAGTAPGGAAAGDAGGGLGGLGGMLGGLLGGGEGGGLGGLGDVLGGLLGGGRK